MIIMLKLINYISGEERINKIVSEIDQDNNLSNRMSKGHSEHEVQLHHDFGSKLSFTVGMCFLFGVGVGLTRATIQSWQTAPTAFQKILVAKNKLKITNFINNLSKYTTQNANAFAAFGLLYTLSGGALNLLFEEELDQVSSFWKNTLCGLVTGTLYKLPRGYQAASVGGLVGATGIAVFSKLIEYGNEKGYISFQMNY